MSGIRILVLCLPFLFLDGALLKPDGFRKPQPGKPWVPPTVTYIIDDKYKQPDPGRIFELLYQTPPPLLDKFSTQTATISYYEPWTNSTPSTPYYNTWFRQTPSTPSYMPLPAQPPSNQVNLSLGFRCPQAYGNYKYSDKCDEYIQCRNYIPLAYKCPAGLQFNRNALWTDTPCDVPSKVNCYETLAVQITSTTPAPLNIPAQETILPRDFRCPQTYGYIRQPNQCSSYVECQNAAPRAYTCPFGLHFNAKVQWPNYPCDYPSRAECKELNEPYNPITTTTTTTTTRPPPPTITIAVISPYPQYQVQPNYQCPQSNGFFRHNDQCGEYVECKNNIPRTYSCPPGLQFNPRVQWTDYPCDTPSKAQCNTELAIQQPQTTTTTTTTTAPPPRTPAPALTPSTFSCPQPHGYFRKSDHCGEYVECKNNVPRTYACPAGLHFNPNVDWTEYPCDHPTIAKCK